MDDPYVYHLTRVKSGFGVGTVTIDVFKEFTTDDTTFLADFLLGKIKTCE